MKPNADCVIERYNTKENEHRYYNPFTSPVWVRSTIEAYRFYDEDAVLQIADFKARSWYQRGFVFTPIGMCGGGL